MANIVVLGSFVYDMTARVSKFAENGETIIAKEFFSNCGGKGVNQAVAAKRLGADVEMIGCLGEDPYGQKFLDILKSEGIESRFVFQDKDIPTGIAQIQIDDNIQNRIVVIPGANIKFGLKELDKASIAIKEGKLFISQLELGKEVVFESLRRAKANNLITILNPAPAFVLKKDILEICDYITPNELELSILTNMPTDTVEESILAAKHLVELGAKTVVATLGKNGALVATKDEAYVVPCFKTEAVDTVGAGDSFNAAFAVKILEGATIKDAVIFANAEASLTVRVKGAIPSFHKRNEVDAFSKEQLKK